MNLDFFSKLGNCFKENKDIKNFMNELENNLKKSDDEINILEEMQNKRKISIASRNTIRNKQFEIIKKYKGTKINIRDELEKMAEEVLDKQDKELSDFRKEGHLYLVEEDRNERIYLTDITEKNNVVLEEVDFPKELLNEATEGTVFEYKDGTYIFHSR